MLSPRPMSTHVIALLLGFGLAPTAVPAATQLADLQPGRNFPASTPAFGGGHTEDLEMADVDNDGDADVGVANGGNASAQPNRLYINNGGAQSGTPGTFTDETVLRFGGLFSDTSRDIEFVDTDGDGDLDIYVSNRGTVVNGGEPSRFWRNRAGMQQGPVGFYSETTDADWGQLVSVPLGKQVVGGDAGPFRDHSCDCDFADLDDDGDLDLFHSSYGPGINGADPSRVFLNDGLGVFDELWPWADAAADVALHTLDIDLVDLDDDFDIDVFASSRESQARVYVNNLSGGAWAGDPFTDVTQTALLDTGAGLVGTNNYGTEYADLDGDGDFDLWMTSYSGFANPILVNNGDLTFSKTLSWIKADTASDDNEADFMDYDGDGDLDALVSGFIPGTNHVYVSGLAQGLGPGPGFYHRAGTGAGGSLAPFPETPSVGNGGTTLDGGAADLDGDGDPDVLLGNDGGQPNAWWENVLGIPDVHAPGFHQLTAQADKSDGTDTPIHAAVRDNTTYYAFGAHDARLVYSVDGGPETCVPMVAQGSQQYLGVIPAALDGEISYRVEVTDPSGNTGVSVTTVYQQGSSAVSTWQVVGCGTPGAGGAPTLLGTGTLAAGTQVTLRLAEAAPSAAALLLISLSSTPAPFKGGVLHAVPEVLSLPLATDTGGLIVLAGLLPGGLPSGTPFWSQMLVADAQATGGVSLSNALLGTTP